jgi:hypothetical protein
MGRDFKQKAKYQPIADIIEIHVKSPKYRYVDDLPEFKTQIIIYFMVVTQPPNRPKLLQICNGYIMLTSGGL